MTEASDCSPLVTPHDPTGAEVEELERGLSPTAEGTGLSV